MLDVLKNRATKIRTQTSAHTFQHIHLYTDREQSERHTNTYTIQEYTNDEGERMKERTKKKINDEICVCGDKQQQQTATKIHNAFSLNFQIQKKSHDDEIQFSMCLSLARYSSFFHLLLLALCVFFSLLSCRRRVHKEGDGDNQPMCHLFVV